MTRQGTSNVLFLDCFVVHALRLPSVTLKLSFSINFNILCGTVPGREGIFDNDGLFYAGRLLFMQVARFTCGNRDASGGFSEKEKFGEETGESIDATISV